MKSMNVMRKVIIVIGLLLCVSFLMPGGIFAEAKADPVPRGRLNEPSDPRGFGAPRTGENADDTVMVEVALTNNAEGEREILDAINAYRRELDLEPLNWDPALAEKARDRMFHFIVNGLENETSDRRPYPDNGDTDYYDFYRREIYEGWGMIPLYSDGRYRHAEGIDLAEVKSVGCVSHGSEQTSTILILSEREVAPGFLPDEASTTNYKAVPIHREDLEITFNLSHNPYPIIDWDEMEQSYGVSMSNLQGDMVFEFGPRSIRYETAPEDVATMRSDGIFDWSKNGAITATAYLTDLDGNALLSLAHEFTFDLPPKPVYTELRSVAYNFEETAREVLRLVNIERQKEGVDPVVWHTDSAEYAALRAAECALRFSHTRPNGEGALGFPDIYGENIAAGNRLAEAVMVQWMESPGHRNNILNPRWKSMSVGAYGRDDDYPYVWVQCFSPYLPELPEAEPQADGTRWEPVVPVNLVEVNIAIEREPYEPMQSPMAVKLDEVIVPSYIAYTNISGDQFTYLPLAADEFVVTTDNEEMIDIEDDTIRVRSGGEANVTFTLHGDPALWTKTVKLQCYLQGWVKRGDDIYYYVDNVPVKGLQKIGKTHYYFDNRGVQQRGWHVVNGYEMYFNLINGGRLTGLQTINNTTYLLTPRGKMSGWHVVRGKALYFDPRHGNGLVTGMRKIGNTVYMLSEDGKQCGWQRSNGKDYYFDPDYGCGMVTGKRKVGDTWYLLTANGKRFGWHILGGGKYYFAPEYGGGMVTGLRKIGTGTYYFRIKNEGTKATAMGTAVISDRVLINHRYYYFDARGLLYKVE